MLKSVMRWLGGAVAAFMFAASPAWAGESLGRSVEWIVYTATDYGDAVAKFDAELIRQRDLVAETDVALRSDLMREGHGFRLAGAEPLMLAPGVAVG